MKNYKSEYVLKNKKTLIVRTPIENDAERLIELMKKVDTETKFLAREEDEFNFTLEQEKEFIRNCNTNSNSVFLVGEVDGKIVSNCSVAIVMKNKRYLHRASMGIVVEKEFWRMGIGEKLMLEAIDWSKKNGFEQLELEVASKNVSGLSLYKKMGFEVSGTKKHALKYSDGSYADQHFMLLFLDNYKI